MKAKNEAEKIAEGKRVEAALVSLDADMPRDLKSAALTDIIGRTEDITASVKALKAELAVAVDAKTRVFQEMNEFLKRARAGAKAVYGDDSLEYERLGGKRRSERKRPIRKVENADKAVAV